MEECHVIGQINNEEFIEVSSHEVALENQRT